jgi:hypothetical protein
LEDGGAIDGVERRYIDELWRKKWRRKKVGRGRLVEEAKGVSKKSRGERKG